MQRAHLFEALLMVNQGIDTAVQGLQRLKKKSEVLQQPFAEAVARLESDRAQANVRFFAVIERSQQNDAERVASGRA
jgi:vacuolar-type H+-ATPase subunit D/Vma8